MLHREAEVARIELDRSSDVRHLVADAVKADAG
jgi:hypothetical protein